MPWSNALAGGSSGWQTRLARGDFGGGPGLVPELGEELTCEALELAPVGVVHLRLPDLDSLRLGRFRGHRMRLHPLLPGERAPGAALALAVHLLQALCRSLVVVEHGRVEVEIDELAHAPQRRLGVEDDVLVADLEVAVA